MGRAVCVSRAESLLLNEPQISAQDSQSDVGDGQAKKYTYFAPWTLLPASGTTNCLGSIAAFTAAAVAVAAAAGAASAFDEKDAGDDGEERSSQDLRDVGDANDSGDLGRSGVQFALCI